VHCYLSQLRRWFKYGCFRLGINLPITRGLSQLVLTIFSRFLSSIFKYSLVREYVKSKVNVLNVLVVESGYDTSKIAMATYSSAGFSWLASLFVSQQLEEGFSATHECHSCDCYCAKNCDCWHGFYLSFLANFKK
jgi:hypothetical protein